MKTKEFIQRKRRVAKRSTHRQGLSMSPPNSKVIQRLARDAQDFAGRNGIPGEMSKASVEEYAASNAPHNLRVRLVEAWNRNQPAPNLIPIPAPPAMAAAAPAPAMAGPSGGAAAGRPQRVSYVPEEHYERLVHDLQNEINRRVRGVFRSIGAFHPYDMQGDESASTQTASASYKTTDQMHAEMMAVDRDPDIRVDGAHAEVRGKFKTDQPHCAYCTFFLQVLGLPLTKPSKGLFKFAGNLDYPLPASVRTNPHILARILGEPLFHRFISMTNRSEVFDLEHFLQSPYLRYLWRAIFTGINSVAKEK